MFQFVRQIGTLGDYFGNVYAGYPPGYKLYNAPVTVLERWQKPGDITAVQRYNSNALLYGSLSYERSSDAYYSNAASFVKLKNVSLSYELPASIVRRLKIQHCRIYVHGENLITISRYKGLDPETQGIGLPPLRIVTGGMLIGL